MADESKLAKYRGRRVTQAQALEGLDACAYCGLFLAPRVLPDKYDRDAYCWRLRAPGSSFEAADMRECLQRLKARLDASQALQEASGDRYLQTIAGLEAQVQAALAEREEARDWVRRLTAERCTLTCVYCGHEYPPGSPAHGAEVLTEHVRACAKHPMRALEAELVALRAAWASHDCYPRDGSD